jgi:hypothetical protein
LVLHRCGQASDQAYAEFFDACKEDRCLDHIPADGHIIVVGCEAHVRVQQTVLYFANVRFAPILLQKSQNAVQLNFR